jgi:hypothetical protein
LRKVVKAKPQKKIKETDAIFDNIKKRAQYAFRGVDKPLSLQGALPCISHLCSQGQ